MLGPPVDSPALYAGLVIAAAALLAVAGSLPTRPAPDAAGVADTVDRVAVDDGPATASHDHGAETVRLRPSGIAMRNDGGTARATFAFGPVTPVGNGSVGNGSLAEILAGAAPESVFDDRAAFRAAVDAARGRAARWVPSDRITVTGVSWDGYRVTLVGV